MDHFWQTEVVKMCVNSKSFEVNPSCELVAAVLFLT